MNSRRHAVSAHKVGISAVTHLYGFFMRELCAFLQLLTATPFRQFRPIRRFAARSVAASSAQVLEPWVNPAAVPTCSSQGCTRNQLRGPVSRSTRACSRSSARARRCNKYVDKLVFTTRPSPLGRSAGKAARVSKMGATRSTSIIVHRRHCRQEHRAHPAFPATA